MLPIKYTIPLHKIDPEDLHLVGKYAVQKSEMLHGGIPITEGFVITTHAFSEFFKESHLQIKIAHLLGSVNLTNDTEREKVALQIQNEIRNTSFPESLTHTIFAAYKRISGILKDSTVRIRISPLDDTSYVPLQAHGEANVLLTIKDAWASLYTASSLKNSHHRPIALCIEKIPDTPLTGSLETTSRTDTKRISISASNKGTTETYKVMKEIGTIAVSSQSVLKKKQVTQLCELAKKIEAYFYFPQQVDFAIEKKRIIILALHPLSQEEPLPDTPLQTATKVFVTLAEPSLAVEISKRQIDGVGLLQGDHLLKHLNIHPKHILHTNKRKEYVEQLAQMITSFAQPFSPRPIIYRLSDFVSTDYRKLPFGEQYDPFEENPLLGFHGSYRHLHDPETIHIELDAIKQVRNKMGYKNIWLLLPFVRTTQELQELKQVIASAGLYRSTSFKIYMMVEVPSTVILLEKFIEGGIDGIAIGINILTSLTLGIDAKNPELTMDFDNEAVMWSLERVIKTSQRHRLPALLCGLDVTSHQNILEKIITWGISGISVSPETAQATREIIGSIEKNLVIDK